MRRAIAIPLVLIAVLVAGVCYFLYGREFEYRFTEAQLQEALDARLPVEKTYLFVLQVTLDHPRVVLIEGSNRVNAGLDVLLGIRIADSSLPLAGSIDASGGIRYEPAEARFYLTDPMIASLQLQGVPAEYASRVSNALTLALREYYAVHPIFTLSSSDAKQVAAKLVLKSVVVENRELVVTLGIGR